MPQSKFIEGTVTELVNRGISINGATVDAVGFSVLAKYRGLWILMLTML